MIRRPPRSTLFPYTDALPISRRPPGDPDGALRRREDRRGGRVGADTLDHPAAAAAHDGARRGVADHRLRSEEHTSELQSRQYLVCRLLLEKKKQNPLSSTYRA